MPSFNSRRYGVAPLFCRPWTLNGISPRLIESHYEHIYGGCVARLNKIADELAALDPATTPPGPIARFKREELTALNSTLLHELYFASLGGHGRRARGNGRGARARLRQRGAVAAGVHRARRSSRWRLRLGAV